MQSQITKNFIRVNQTVETVPYLESVISANRLNFLTDHCKKVLTRTPGNVLEVGVYRGGSFLRLVETVREVCPDFCVIGIDTFTGHPYSDGHPAHPKGKYADVEINKLESQLSNRGLTPWFKLVKGMVEDVLTSLNLSDISYAHIDCDLYKPISFCAETVPVILKKEGMLYFDDYGHEHCPGATRAINEHFEDKCLHEVYMPEDGTCWSCYLESPWRCLKSNIEKA